MHKFHPETKLFFTKFKQIIDDALDNKKISIERCIGHDYQHREQQVFDYNYNYYFTPDENTSIIRYHIKGHEEKENFNISQTMMEDLINAFVNPNVCFQWLLGYCTSSNVEWSEMFFNLNMPDSDREKIFSLLGPSNRINHFINEQKDKPHFFNLIVNTYEKYGGEIIEMNFKDTLEHILKNEYADDSLSEELLLVAKKYIKLYSKKFGHYEYKQLEYFDVLRCIVPTEKLMFFKDSFNKIEFLEPKDNKKSILDKEEVYIEKLAIDYHAIAANFPEFKIKDDVLHIISYFIRSVQDDKKNSFNIDNIYLNKYLYVESKQPINTDKITYCLYYVLEEMSRLSFTELKSIKDNSIECISNKTEFKMLNCYIFSAHLDYDLKCNEVKSMVKKI